MASTEEMFQTKDKLDLRITELSDYRYRDRISIPSFHFMIDEEGEVGAYPPVDGQWQTIKVGDRWEGSDMYAWLAYNIQVPETWNNHQILGLFELGDSPYQGIDKNHQEVFFSSDFAGKTMPLRFRLWTSFEGGIREHKIRQAEIVWLDEETDDLYFTSKAVLETVKVLNQDSPEHHQLLNALDRSFYRLDWSDPGSEPFYESVKQAQALLKYELEHMEKHHPATIHCIGHSHIDAAWKWRLKHTREKLPRTFSTVLRLMERYPEYSYIQSTPQFYDYLKNDYPEIFEQVKERINEGRWEADGSMWLEADNNLPSGESLVRQILVGTQFFQEEFGVDCKILWLPDTFGYSWALPQILKKSGIDYFLTIKISWNEYNRMPHDTFYWRGLDGSEILTHFSTSPASRDAHPNGWQYIYNSDITPSAVAGTWNNNQDKHFNNDLSLLYGHGDGGGGAYS